MIAPAGAVVSFTSVNVPVPVPPWRLVAVTVCAPVVVVALVHEYAVGDEEAYALVDGDAFVTVPFPPVKPATAGYATVATPESASVNDELTVNVPAFAP